MRTIKKNEKTYCEEERRAAPDVGEMVYEEDRFYRVEGPRDCGRHAMSRRSGMELVQVALLICIAVAVGLVFKEKIILFVNSTFDGLLNSGF